MPVSLAETFRIENQTEDDVYLESLLANEKYRSMDEVQRRAQGLIEDPRIKQYFLDKAAEMLRRSS